MRACFDGEGRRRSLAAATMAGKRQQPRWTAAECCIGDDQCIGGDGDSGVQWTATTITR